MLISCDTWAVRTAGGSAKPTEHAMKLVTRPPTSCTAASDSSTNRVTPWRPMHAGRAGVPPCDALSRTNVTVSLL
jgi:hypothetical protein